MDMYDFWINMGTTAILTSLKNPDKVAVIRRVMLKIFRAIKNAYPGDPDFQ